MGKVVIFTTEVIFWIHRMVDAFVSRYTNLHEDCKLVEWDVEFTPCPTVLWWNCFARSQPGQPGHVARCASIRRYGFRGFAHEVPPIPKVFLMFRWHKACLDVVQCGQATNIRSRNLNQLTFRKLP